MSMGKFEISAAKQGFYISSLVWICDVHLNNQGSNYGQLGFVEQVGRHHPIFLLDLKLHFDSMCT